MDGLTTWLAAQLDADEQWIKETQALIDDHTRATACYEGQDGWQLRELPESRAALQRAAVRYADRDGYRQEWRP